MRSFNRNAVSVTASVELSQRRVAGDSILEPEPGDHRAGVRRQRASYTEY